MSGLRRSLAAVLLVLPATLALGACGEQEATTPATTTAVEQTQPGFESTIAPRTYSAQPYYLREFPPDWLRVREGERVALYDEPGGERVAHASDRTEFGSPMSLGVLDTAAGGRWLEVTTSLGPANRPLWVRDDRAAIVPRSSPYAIRVDLGERRLRLRKGGRTVRAFPVTIGAAATSTPTGRFAITDVIVRDLDHEVYGCCALALSAHQPSLPAGWIGGDRVAIHGTDGPLGLAASSGCIRMRNDELADLSRTVGLGTPVVIEE